MVQYIDWPDDSVSPTILAHRAQMHVWQDDDYDYDADPDAPPSREQLEKLGFDPHETMNIALYTGDDSE